MTDHTTHHTSPATAASGEAAPVATPAGTPPSALPPSGEVIELRSEKAPRSIGAIPRSLTVWSLLVTLFFFAAIILAVCLIPYPYSRGESILQHLLGQ